MLSVDLISINFGKMDRIYSENIHVYIIDGVQSAKKQQPETDVNYARQTPVVYVFFKDVVSIRRIASQHNIKKL